MLFINKIWQKHANGPGGIRELLKISFPIIISQASSSLMMFTDRLLLTPLGREYPSASMVGGFFCFIWQAVFFGMLNYINPLAAQYLGAEKKERCLKVLGQGLLLALLFYPVIVVGGALTAPYYLGWAQLPEKEIELAIAYLEIILWGSFAFLGNTALSAYFTGLGKTTVVMIINVTGMLLNIPLTYWYVHQTDYPVLSGIRGAPFATVLSGIVMLILFGIALYRLERKNPLGLHFLKFDREIIGKLVFFGGPTGVEFFLSFFAFNTFVTLFHSYGPNEGLAMTIAFNWDIVAFLPLWGLNIGMMSMVGKYMGARELAKALRTTFSGAKIAYLFTIGCAVSFFLFTETFVAAFLPPNLEDERALIGIAVPMLKAVAIYLLANATVLVFSATLRASGDTRWCMVTTIACDWMMLTLAYLSIRVYEYSPLTTWGIFVGMIFIAGALYFHRFMQGRWKSIHVV